MPRKKTVTINSFAHRLKRMREKAGRTRYWISQQTGIDQTYLGRLEAGTVDNPSWDVVQKLADALDASTVDFRTSTE